MELGSFFVSLIGGMPGPSRPFESWIEDAEKLLKAQEQAGFSFAAFTHGYHSSSGFHPFPLMSRLAAVSGEQRLGTQVLLLPLLNPMDVAYNVATLDHITGGRLDFGIGLGYHPRELEPAGISRADRVPKFEEAVHVMKRFWSGEPVHHQGRYFHSSGTQMGFAPVQKPHPPLWGAGQSRGAVARAGRMLDGVVIGPQVSHRDAGSLVETFREEWHKVHNDEPTRIGAWRAFVVGKDPRDAVNMAVAGGLQFTRYLEGRMREVTTVDLPLELTEENAVSWTFAGSYGDCLEGLRRCRDELGLTHVTCQFHNLPGDMSARLEWIEGFGEEVVRKL